MRRHPLALAAVAAALMIAAPPARAEEDEDDGPTVSVNGTGRISAAPDVAEINVGVITRAATAREALSANNATMAKLHEALKAGGVAAKDIQTSQLNVSPQYSQPQPGFNPNQGEFVPRIVGYQVSNSVQVTARDLGKLGGLLDTLVQGGANQVHGISFRVDEPETLLDEARKRAMADARRKAELLCGEAGAVLGPPRRIRETGGQVAPPRPAYIGRMALAAAEAVPIASGEQELSVTVEVEYALRQAP